MDRSSLITTIEAAGWQRDEEGDWVLVNGYIRLNPDGTDDNTAVIGDMEADVRRAISYRQAAAWATGDHAEFVRPDNP